MTGIVVQRFGIVALFSQTICASTQHTSAASFDGLITHLAVVPDGNRRWAKERGLDPWIGHREGVKPLKTAVQFCIKHKIPYLSAYVFSLENFRRPEKEVSYLFDVLANDIFTNELDDLIKNGVRVRVVGDRAAFPEKLRTVIEHAEERTKEGTALTLVFLFCYGGQQELVASVRDIARAVADRTLSPDSIDEKIIADHLWTHDIPNPELIIRTGGMQRLSNFLLYRAAYSELCFMKKYWPDVTERDLEEALEQFAQTTRNFGA